MHSYSVASYKLGVVNEAIMFCVLFCMLVRLLINLVLAHCCKQLVIYVIVIMHAFGPL